MVYQLFRDFFLIFVPLFVVIDPAGTLPLFLALTGQQTELRRRFIARRAAIVAGAVGVAFVIVGQAVFTLLGIRFADFQIAGGILVTILAVLDLLSPGKPAVSESELKQADATSDSVSVVPLAVPLIVGPATMTTSLLLVSSFSPRYSLDKNGFGPELGPMIVIAMVCLALIANLFLLYLAMRHASAIERLVGKSVMLVINKIVMILLAAIAVSLIRQGVITIVMDPTGQR